MSELEIYHPRRSLFNIGNVDGIIVPSTKSKRRFMHASARRQIFF